MQLRRARPADAAAIAEVHVAGWRWGYRDLLPERALAALSLERRRRAWEHSLADAARWLWVAERDDAVVGFVAAGPARDDRGAEIYALYQLERVAGGGVARALLERAQLEARARGFDGAMLWVLETNTRARGFYERCGWAADGGHKVETLEGVELVEVRYRRPLGDMLSARPARAADVAALLAMMPEFNAIEGIVLDSGELERALVRLLEDETLGRVLLFEHQSAIAGYAVVTWGYDLEHGGRDAFLTEIYLREEARGRGFGHAALAACEAAARDAGARALHLMVRPENEPAVRLYRGAGYESPPRILLSRRLA